MWGIDISMGGVDVFHDCYIDPVVPEAISHRLRLCSGRNTITSCPLDFVGNQTIKELCESYTALVFEPSKSFRNVHCAICNNASLESLYCLNLGPLGRSKWQQNFNLFSFAVLFDIGGDLDEPVGGGLPKHSGSIKCDKDKLFDPFFKKCRSVYCQQSNHIYDNGACIEINKETEENIRHSTIESIVTPPLPSEDASPANIGLPDSSASSISSYNIAVANSAVLASIPKSTTSTKERQKYSTKQS